MKCNVCGSEIDGIVGLCPYCFSNLYTDAEQLEKEKISFLMESCPDLSKEYKGKLLDVDIIFDRDYSQIINANLFLSSMFECDQERFAQKIMEFKSVDTYVDDVIKVAKEIISDSAYMITALLQKNEIEISRKDVYTLCSQSIDIYMSGIDSIINSGDETRDKKNNDLTKKFQNEMANPEYIKFMGIGYGMKGAMDASIQSSLLNAGSRLVSDTASIAMYTLGVAFNNISLNLKKKELIKSEDFINYVIKLFKVSEGEIACKINRKINENLFVKLFGKNSVEKNRIKQIKKMKIDKKEKTHRIIEVLKDSPFYLEGYQELYSVLEETRGSEILKYVNDLIYKSNIETMLMSLDAAQISRCAYAANDSYNQALEKLKTLHNISQQGSAYNNYLFSEDPNAKMLKNYLIRNWKRCVSENITNLSIYFKDVHMLEEDWNRADGSILYATALFQKYLTLYEACKTASDIEKFEEIVQKNLDNCKNKSTSAKCIWADMGMRISIWTKKDYTKFWDTLIEESDQANSLALSIIGIWCEQGHKLESKNTEKAEVYFRNALLQGNPIAISYIAKMYKYGTNGYPKDVQFSKELFTLVRYTPVAIKER